MPKASIIIPTYNEADNIRVLLERIMNVMNNSDIVDDYEIVIVDDDSPDKTALVARNRAVELGISSKVKVIVRKGVRGLSTAIIEGIKNSVGEYIVVMDADLQHPPEKIPELLKRLNEGNEIVVATRYRGGVDQGLSLPRKIISRLAGLLAKLMIPQAKFISDPMSGFFAFKRSVVEKKINEMNPSGFKILLEILVKGDYDVKRICEVPYVFSKRLYGESKLGLNEMFNYIMHLLRLNNYRILKFAAVGATGVFVNEGMLYLLHYKLLIPLFVAGALAIETSILNNFTLNSLITFRNVKTKTTLLSRLYMYHIATLLGVSVNYIVLLFLSYVLKVEPLLANFIGILLGFLVNYGLSEHYVWRRIGGES